MTNSKRDRRPARGGPKRVGRAPPHQRPRIGGRQPGDESQTVWLFGSHAVAAAVANPRRTVRRILVTGDPAAPAERPGGSPPPSTPAAVKISRDELERLLPEGAVHQGIAAEVLPLPDTAIEDLCEVCADSPRAAVVVLDKVLDPRNVGAILRSIAAFGGAGLVVPDRGAPQESGTVAKAASGALERVPIVRVVNLKRALEQLKTSGFWCIGLDADADTDLPDTRLEGRVALVMGAEGSGLRRLTREACDVLVKIPIRSEMESLNVSTATAVALYEWARSGR